MSDSKNIQDGNSNGNNIFKDSISGNEIVDMIREKTTEVDFDSILKTSMGGYTKKSVFEYLSTMKQQEQKTADSYNAEIHRLLDEKEKLQGEIDILKNRAVKAETDYSVLCQQISEESGEGSGDGILKLRQEYALLSKDMDEAIEKIKDDEKEIQKLKAISERDKKEIESLSQQYKTEQTLRRETIGENENLRKTVSAQASEISRLQGETAYLKEMVSDGSVAELNGKIDELTSQAEVLSKTIGEKNKLIVAGEKRLDALSMKEKTNHETIDKLRSSVKSTQEDNEKLEAEIEGLSKQLSEYIEKYIAGVKECADIKVENVRLARKIDSLKLKSEITKNIPDSPENK